MSYTIPTLGRLQPVDLREVWPSEPYNFTPWLALPENLGFLADSLGLPGLELVKAEHAVDSFSADIVARIVDSEHHVLIENQLERTDHLHLGQLLTYAPRFDAKVIVWVARQFTEAHRAALDWLNSITDERYGFFGVELKAVRIGDSLPAPQFNVVAQPNSWTRPVLAGSATEVSGISDTALSNIDYWDAFHKAAIAAGAPLRKSDRPLKDTNYFAPLVGGTDVQLSAYRSQAQRASVGVFLGLYNASAPFVWQHLLASKEGYDRAFPDPLDWQASADGRLFKIIARLPVNTPSDRADWPRQHAWLVDRFKQLETLFAAPAAEALTLNAERIASQAPV